MSVLGVFALAGLLPGLAGCECPPPVPAREAAGIGFTPTRWTCWDDGPLAYRGCRWPAGGAAAEESADSNPEQLPNPGGPAAETVEPGPKDEAPVAPRRKPAQPDESRPGGEMK